MGRSRRTDAEEFCRLLDGITIDGTQLFHDKLAEWERFYNYHRPHGGLGGQTRVGPNECAVECPWMRSRASRRSRVSGSPVVMVVRASA